MLKKVLLLFGSLLLMVWLKGQCPDRDSLWRQINYLKDHYPYPFSPTETRERLRQIEKKMVPCGFSQDSMQVLLLRAFAATYSREGNDLGVIRYLIPAATLIKRIPNNPAMNERELVRINYYIAVAYRGVNNVPERMKALDTCIATSRRLNYIDRSALNALFDRGTYFFDIGDYYHAIGYFKECNTKAFLYLPHAINAADSAGTISYALSSFVWQVNSHIRLKEYDQAEALLKSQTSQSGINSLNAYQGTFYGVRAEMEVHKGNYDQAIKNFRQALAVERRPLSRKQLFNTMATEVYFKHYRNYDKAMSLYKEGLACINIDTLKFKEDSIESLSIWSSMAEVNVQKGQYDKAFACFRKALDHIKPGISIAQIISSPPAEFVTQKKIHYLTSLLIEQGNTWRRKYTLTHQADELRKAIEIYRQADQLVNRIKGEQANLNSKLFWRSNSHGLYEHALEACHTSGNMEDAFYFFEKSRAVLLNDQLADQRWMGEQDILQQTQAMKTINTLSRALNSTSLTPAARIKMEDERTANQQLLSRLTTTIKTRNPFYYQSFLDSNFVTLQQVKQTMLKDYGALVEIFSGDSAVYVMIVAASDTRLHKINKQAYDSLAGLFIQYITNYNLQNGHFETFTQVSNQLYQLIFAKDRLPEGRLIISPDGQYFPFEALLTRADQSSYLLKEHAISYTYSARYLLNDFTSIANKKAKSFMGFAPVQYAGTQLPDLNESDHSLEALTSYFSGADNFIGPDASRNNFLRHFADYRIIQLYTHAMDNRDKGEPVIYFADSSLYLSDLVSDKKPATSLVVLSACETGTGKVYQGEGVFSFNRGFAALGIPAAITSLWKADNLKTYALTTLFYKFLATGEPADVALQHAKLEFMASATKANALPYFWAVPVLTGKVIDMPAQTTGGWWLVLPAIALGIIFLIIVYRWWRGRRMTRPFQQQTVME
ncbi:CHAT domain-containing protein [Paraflavitalea soli]|uniref:CHAT domain-containing protein n=1 Tax=Paraflavitalea soli TaxID=2315862 RepID=A0A3B7MJP6_9BACT|nr:CHAT domain-containing protein [Paraflavitalea soli]AXY73469.1 CHAT domain-containing protein [Paraflavitalea soli]